MPEEGTSPSSGWEDVYGAMSVSTNAEDDAPTCPDCGEESTRVQVDRYWCPEHGTFTATG